MLPFHNGVLDLLGGRRAQRRAIVASLLLLRLRLCLAFAEPFGAAECAPKTPKHLIIGGLVFSARLFLTQSSREQAKEERQGIISLDVRSEPVEAEVYVDWSFKGQTPMRLNSARLGGLLIVAKDGHQTQFRRLSHRESNGAVDLNLLPEEKHPRARLLLLISENTPDNFYSSLRARLVEEGFTVIGQEEAKEFEQEVSKAGGISHRGLRAWARTRFDTDLLVTARVHQSSRELSEQGFGYPGIEEAVKGIVRSEVGIELEVFDLSSGDHLTAVSSRAEDFALDRAQSVQKALTQAATEASKKLHQQIQKERLEGLTAFQTTQGGER